VIGYGLNQTNRYFRIHHVEFDNIFRRGIHTQGRVEGLIDHCVFRAPYNANAQGITVDGFLRAQSDGQATNNANSSGSIKLGASKDFLYIEDCIFDFAYRNDAGVELYNDAEACVRYCLITNTCIGVHESAKDRTGSAWEFYNNYAYSFNNSTFINIRSGWGVIWSNVLDTIYASMQVQPVLILYRASGTNVYPDGTYWSSTTNYGIGTGLAWGVSGNFRMDGNRTYICIGYPAFDQPGWGDPTVWQGTNSVQTFHGIYSWGNFANGTNNPTIVKGWHNPGLWSAVLGRYMPDPSQLIVENRDYFNNAPMPDYTPLAYPHPLTRTRPASPVLHPVSQ
jgi:hypothetical protein